MFPYSASRSVLAPPAGLMWNAADKTANVVLSADGKTATRNGSGDGGARGTTSKSSGKWYLEAKVIAASTLAAGFGFGTGSTSFNGALGLENGDTGYIFGGVVRSDGNGYDPGGGADVVPGDYIAWAIDLTAGSATAYKNNASRVSVSISAGRIVFPKANFPGNTEAIQLSNFYAPPSGYQPWI